MCRQILLVDDDEDDQSFFREIISEIERDAEVEIAGNGLEALKLLRASIVLPDIIFLDINMPVMNGIEYLTNLAHYPKFEKIPVVVWSTSADDSAIVAKLGTNGFLKKPGSITRMREKLIKVLSYDLKKIHSIIKTNRF